MIIIWILLYNTNNITYVSNVSKVIWDSVFPLKWIMNEQVNFIKNQLFRAFHKNLSFVETGDNFSLRNHSHEHCGESTRYIYFCQSSSIGNTSTQFHKWIIETNGICKCIIQTIATTLKLHCQTNWLDRKK